VRLPVGLLADDLRFARQANAARTPIAAQR